MENITDSMKTFFERIRDERSMHANTANRIGNAFLMILNYLQGNDTPFLRKDREDATRYLLTMLAGAVIGESGRIKLNPDGSIICDSIKVNGSAIFDELVFNNQNVIEGDTFFTNRGVIERVEPLNEGRYRVFLRKEYQNEIITFQQNDILKCSMNNLDAGHTFKNSWMRVNTVDTETNSMDVVLYAHNEVPGGANYAPVPGSIIIRWGNQTNKERQSCWYISSTEKRIVMLDDVTKPKIEEENYAAFFGLPFDMESFKGYSLDQKQPYLYVRGAFLQDVCFIDYKGKIVKQERYRGIWSQEVANGSDPYIVTKTTFDTVYHKNAKWQCNSTKGTKVEPSEGTTDWSKLSEGGKGSDGKSAAKAYVTNDVIAIPTDADGNVSADFSIINEFEMSVDGKKCTNLTVTDGGNNDNYPFELSLSDVLLQISSVEGTEFGTLAWTIHYNVSGELDGETYNDTVSILVIPNRAGQQGDPGNDGKSIKVKSQQIDYAIWSDGTYNNIPHDDQFTSLIIPTTKEKPYLWTRVLVFFSDGSMTRSYSVARQGQDGKPGQDGAPGRNLTKVTNYYMWGTSGVDAPAGDYNEDTIPSHPKGSDYLWNYEVCSDDNGTTISKSGKTCIGYFAKDGDPGQNGKPGRGIVSITEYYQIGTSSKPINAITIINDGKTVNVPNGWQTVMMPTTSDKRYVWNQEVIKYTDGTYSVTAVHLAGAQGDDGIDGNGLEFIYTRTEGYKAPNTPSANGDNTTPAGWTKDPSGVSAEYPYEWVSTRRQEQGKWGSYSKPVLWKEYFALNANLLEQTGFDGLLTKWIGKSVYEGTSYMDNSINHISSDGKDGVNCYYDISTRMKYESLYKDVLIQRLVDNSVTRLKPSTWYTLSFYAKCGVNVKPVNLTSDLYGFGERVVYLERGKRYKFSISGRIDSQAKNDGKSLRCFVYNGDWSWVKAIDINTTSDTTKSLVISDVPSNGSYHFQAYMFENGGSRAGKVTLNWASVEEIDGAIFSSYIFPTLVDNTKVFVDGEQKSVSSDCNVTYKASSSDWVKHTVTFKTRNTLGSKQELLFRMLPIVMSDNTHYLKICMPKLEVGKVASAWQLNEADRIGKNGKPLAGPTEWNASAKYMSGKADDEPYQSIVINTKYPKQMYLCGYTHSGVEPSANTSVASIDSCMEEKPWVQTAYQDFIATKVLFAERGKIENLDITNATIQGTITDMAVTTKAEWDVITNALVPKEDKDLVEIIRNFQIVNPIKAGSYFIPTIDPISDAFDRGPEIVFLPTFNPSSADIITANTNSETVKKRYTIPKYQTAGTHIRITKGSAPLNYSRWAYLEDAELERLWTSGSTNNRRTIRNIYNLGTLICADHKVFRVDGHKNIQGEWYYGNSDYKHGRFSVNGTVARMLWLMPGQSVELVSQIEVINNEKSLVWSVVNASDFTAVNVNVDLTIRFKSDTSKRPIEFYGESSILSPDTAGNVDNWMDCFIAHKKIDNRLLNGEMRELPSLFINRNGSGDRDDYPKAAFYLPD